MAFTTGTINVVKSGNETGQTSTAFAVAATINTGQLCVLCVGMDNLGTADGNTSQLTGIVDSKLNNWIKADEYTNTVGGNAADGATIAVWYSVLTTQLTTSDTITCSYNGTLTAKAAIGYSFNIGTNNTVSVAQTPQVLNNDNSNAGSMTIGSLTNKEYLFYRAIGSETDEGGIITLTTNYNSGSDSTSGSGGSEKGHSDSCGEWRILTGTGDSSNPTMADTSADRASLYIAFQEVSGATGVTGRRNAHGFMHHNSPAIA